MTSYDMWKFVLVTIISLVLNQTWIAVYMMVICAHPGIAHRICPMVSAAGGFSGGFIVPRPAMPLGYSILFYINPVFYGFSAITKVLLQDVRLKCENESILNCISTDGNAVLARFGFDTINIYENLAIMLGITVFSLLFSWLFLEMKYINLSSCIKKSSTFPQMDELLEVSVEPLQKPLPAGQTARRKSTLGIITEDEGFHTIKYPEDFITTIPEEEDIEQEGKSKTLRKQIITEDENINTIKRPEHGDIVTTPEQEDIKRDRRPRSRKLSREVRWQSVRKRRNQRRESAELQMENFHRITKQLHQGKQKQGSLTSRCRSLTFPDTEEKTPKATRRILSCGDDAAEARNVLALAAVKPKAEQEKSTNGCRDTSL